MSDSHITNEQKLEAIFRIVTEQEERRKTAFRLRLLKWCIFAGVVYFIVSQPEMILSKVTEILKPFVLSTASGMISNQKNEFMKSIKDVLPSGMEVKEYRPPPQ